MEEEIDVTLREDDNDLKKQKSSDDNKSLCTIIGLGFTTFLLKIGLILQYILTMISQYKTIAALTVLLTVSASANVYLTVEYEIVTKEFEKCMSGEISGTTEYLNSTEITSSTESTTNTPATSTSEVSTIDPEEPEEPE